MEILIPKLKKFRFIFLAFSIINIVYILICDIFATFSISVTIVFLVFALMNFLIYLVLKKAKDYSGRPPSFIIVFIQLFYIVLNISFLVLFIINVSFKKNTLPKNDEYDYIIVFGAGIKADEDRNFIINSRLDKALEYAKNYKKTVFVLTGAKVDEEPIEEAMYMKNFLTSNGIELDRIMTDTKSINSYQNLYNSYALIEKDMLKRNRTEQFITTPFNTSDDLFDLEILKLGLMSSEFHLTRLVMISKKLGVSNPYVIAADTAIWYKPYCYMRENLSLFKAWVLGELKFN